MQTTISTLHEENPLKISIPPINKHIPIWSISTKFNKITQLQWFFLVVWGFIGLLWWCGGFSVMKQCCGGLIGNVLVMGCWLGRVELGFQQCGKVGAYNFSLAICLYADGVSCCRVGSWLLKLLVWLHCMTEVGILRVSVSAKVMGGGIGFIG